MSKALPKSLEYLKPVFVNLRNDLRAGLELDEERDNSDIEHFLGQRVRGLTRADARAALRTDREALEKWLDGQPRHPGHYLIGYLSAIDDPKLVAKLGAAKSNAAPPPREPPRPVGRLTMAGPNGRKFRRIKGVLIMFDDDAMPSAGLAAVPLSHAKAKTYAKAWDAAGVPARDVSFGSVRGRRYVLDGNPNYLLSLKNGAVHVSIDLRGGKFDEAQVVSVFPTIKLE